MIKLFGRSAARALSSLIESATKEDLTDLLCERDTPFTKRATRLIDEFVRSGKIPLPVNGIVFIPTQEGSEFRLWVTSTDPDIRAAQTIHRRAKWSIEKRSLLEMFFGEYDQKRANELFMAMRGHHGTLRAFEDLVPGFLVLTEKLGQIPTEQDILRYGINTKSQSVRVAIKAMRKFCTAR